MFALLGASIAAQIMFMAVSSYTRWLTPLRIENSIQQMEIEPNLAQVDFEIAVNSFHDELICKLQYFNTVEIELLRKFECNINLPETHTELVFYLRNMIQLLEEAFKDVQSYFTDLRMNFLYDYFRKVQVLMISGFNFLSQALLIQIDQNEKEKDYKSKTKEMDRIIVKHRTEKEPIKNLKQQAKEMEHYDFAINYYENEQAKITEELHRMQDNIMMSKGLIDKLHPSKAVKELQEIKQRAEITLENTEKIFEETYQLKYLEFKQYLSKLQRPEDVTKDFCDNLKITMRDKFQSGMKKSVNILYSIKKEDELAKHIVASVQTDQIELPTVKLEKKATTPAAKNGEKLQNLLIKERKLTQKLLAQLQNAKKQIEFLLSEKNRQQTFCKGLELKIRELSYNYDILSKIYDEKREEITILKKGYEQKDFLIDKLRGYELIACLRDATNVEDAAQTEEQREFCEAEVQANMQDNEIIVILKKTNQKMGEKIRQKEIRIKQIEKKQITEKKEKISRLRISQAIAPEIIAVLAKQASNQNRSSLSSDKSLSSAHTIKQDKEKSSYINDKSIKDYTKLLVKPSNFSIKRYSNKQIIVEKEKRASKESKKRISVSHVAEVGVQANINLTEKLSKGYTSKEMQTDFSPEHQRPLERRTEGVRFEQQQKNNASHERLIETLSNRKHQKRFLKKHLTSSKEKKWQKEVSAESNREDFSLSNRYDQFADNEEPAVEGERQQIGIFENLNLESEQCKLALQKRSALSKKFLYNVKRKEKGDEADEKNKTCVGQFYKPRKHQESLQTKHLICIDKIDLNKKQSKKYEKMSINSKPSEKIIKPIEKQNTDKYSKAKRSNCS